MFCVFSYWQICRLDSLCIIYKYAIEFYELGFSTIICPNLREFGLVIVRDHVWDPPYRISGWTVQFLFGQVDPINMPLGLMN
jgi:hypothetical protein